MSLTIFKRDPMTLFESVFYENVSPFVSSIVTPSFKVDISEDESSLFIEAAICRVSKKRILRFR